VIFLEQRLWQVLSSIQEGIRYSDGKAVALLGIQGLLIGFAIVFVKNSADSVDINDGSKIVAIAGIIFIAVSMIFSFICMSPRLKNALKRSPIYFGSIAKNFADARTYLKYVKTNCETEDSNLEFLAEQIHTNSIIATTKFKTISWSIKFLVLGLLFWVVFFLINVF
jgi:hypothetical protein